MQILHPAYRYREQEKSSLNKADLLDYIRHRAMNTETMPSDSCVSYIYNQVCDNGITTNQTCCFWTKGEGKGIPR